MPERVLWRGNGFQRQKDDAKLIRGGERRNPAAHAARGGLVIREIRRTLELYCDRCQSPEGRVVVPGLPQVLFPEGKSLSSWF